MEFNIICLAKQWLWFCFFQWIIRRHVSPWKQLLPYFERQLLPPWHLEATSPDLDDPTEPPAIVNVKVFVNIVNFVVNILDVVDDLYKDKSRFRTKLPCNCAHIRLRKKHIFNKGTQCCRHLMERQVSRAVFLPETCSRLSQQLFEEQEALNFWSYETLFLQDQQGPVYLFPV